MTEAKRMTKAQIMSELAEKTGLNKKDVASVFDELRGLIQKELSEPGPGEFVIPDLLKLKVRKVPPQPAGERMDPFTKQMRHFDEKPASMKVRATPLKKLKDLVG